MAVLSFSVIYLSAGCRPVTTIPIHGPLKGSDIGIASVYTLSVTSYFKIFCKNPDQDIFLHQWSEKNKKVPPAPILTHIYQLMTLAYVHHCDEPSDHIFTVDNLFLAGCSTRAIRRVRGHQPEAL